MAKSDSSDDEEGKLGGRRANKAIDSQKARLDRLMQNPEKSAHIPDGPKDKPPPPPAEYVRFYMGSSAGAGSGEFHIYRNLRRKEQNRMKFIDDQAKKDKLRTEFEIQADKNRAFEEQRTAKKRAKRLKQKARQGSKKSKTATTSESKIDSESELESGSSEEEEPNPIGAPAENSSEKARNADASSTTASPPPVPVGKNRNKTVG